MKKAECEQAIRQMCNLWAREQGFDTRSPGAHPSYYEFKNWASTQGYSRYWDFRATGGADYHAEMWFDDEFKQGWRN
ncbi:hypothetical protein [Shinella zoogloeoides]|uniref:Uncharacterized protein n=1 Tax=Shinella zoogloeoides TaxID=352475 RepID=A0A6N8TKC2_SHIZO|nr:hypothetical protein [Shinella zoogloeoides]MXO03111.1 hypothetical protein [Shinella zoogloeoides]UEX81970.1 hypothetical protein K8M09_01300 [Shinella zoogloeoides]